LDSPGFRAGSGEHVENYNPTTEAPPKGWTGAEVFVGLGFRGLRFKGNPALNNPAPDAGDAACTPLHGGQGVVVGPSRGPAVPVGDGGAQATANFSQAAESGAAAIFLVCGA